MNLWWTWNVTVRNIFNLPWTTYRYLIEGISQRKFCAVVFSSFWMPYNPAPILMSKEVLLMPRLQRRLFTMNYLQKNNGGSPFWRNCFMLGEGLVSSLDWSTGSWYDDQGHLQQLKNSHGGGCFPLGIQVSSSH